MGWKKKAERALFKNRMSAATERRRGKRSSLKKTQSFGEGGGRVYVLDLMSVTFPTCHLERSPLKAPLKANTVPHRNRECLKNRISASTKKKGKRNSQKRFDLEEGKKRVYILASMVVTSPTCHLERSPLKAPAV